MNRRVQSFTHEGLVHFYPETTLETFVRICDMIECCRSINGGREARPLFYWGNHGEMHFQIVICGGSVTEKTNLIRRLATQEDVDFHIVAERLIPNNASNVRMLRGQIENVFRRYQEPDNNRHVILFLDNFEEEKMRALEGWDWNNSKVKLILGINEQLSEEAQRYLEVLFGGIYTANLLRNNN